MAEAPTGFMCIKRHVFLAMRQRYPELNYVTSPKACACKGGGSGGSAFFRPARSSFAVIIAIIAGATRQVSQRSGLMQLRHSFEEIDGETPQWCGMPHLEALTCPTS